MSDAPGLAQLRRMRLFEPRDGMWANLRMRLTAVDSGTTVVEADLTHEEHGSGDVIHRGAVAAVADGALACAAGTLVGEGEVPTTVELLMDFFQPAHPGHVIARARVLHRAGHLVHCAATVEQGGAVIAEGHATIGLVRQA
jgi:uncharacterized protein (TIGR00369 family)